MIITINTTCKEIAVAVAQAAVDARNSMPATARDLHFNTNLPADMQNLLDMLTNQLNLSQQH